MNYIVWPYEGVGDLKFGMSRTDVSFLIGAPARSKKSRFSDDVTDYWHENGLQLTFDTKADSLVEISLYPNLGTVTLGDIDVFAPPRTATYQALCRADGQPKATVGITVLFSLGVAMAGFRDDDAGDTSITAFSRGRWAEDEADLKPVQVS